MKKGAAMERVPEARMLDTPEKRKLAYAMKQANAFFALSLQGAGAYYGGARDGWLAVTPNLAFAAELYLKVLRALRGAGNWPRGHDLKQLFDGLPHDDRKELARRYEQIRSWGPPGVLDRFLPGRDLSLAGVLNESKDAFARLRYAFEYEADPTADPLPDAFGLLWFVRVLKPYIEEQNAPL